MAASVAIYHIPGHKRSTIIANAMAAGIRRVGDPFRIIESSRFREPEARVAVFYGFDQQMRVIFEKYRKHNLPVVYVDLGYFGRLEGGKWSGYHKVSVNDRHPTKYFQARPHDSSRVSRFRLTFNPWKDGRHILICGTSDKGALVDGFRPQQWETETINLLRKVTQRPLIYRPKPSWNGASPIPGSVFAQSKEDVSRWLHDCHAVVSHHSNVCVDAFLAGVPNFCVEGVGAPLSETDFSKIDTPRKPDGRELWAQDLAFTQYRIGEMEDGIAWRHLKNEGLVP